jgi:TatA/E family protein of Tat protein translocase
VVGPPLAALDNPLDLLVLVVLAFLLFGKDLPEVARNLGKGIRELKESVNFDEVRDAVGHINEVRSLASPANIARAALPGMASVQDAVSATRDAALTDPFAPADAPPAADPSAVPPNQPADSTPAAGPVETPVETL